jgi:hypothetical protein
MNHAVRAELADAIRACYASAARKGQASDLTEFVAATGYGASDTNDESQRRYALSTADRSVSARRCSRAGKHREHLHRSTAWHARGVPHGVSNLGETGRVPS